MRSTPDNDRPETDRRKASRRRTTVRPASTINSTGSDVVRLQERRAQQDRRVSGSSVGASSGMRIKAAGENADHAAPQAPQPPQAIAKSMIDALTDILRYEQSQQRRRAS